MLNAFPNDWSAMLSPIFLEHTRKLQILVQTETMV